MGWRYYPLPQNDAKGEAHVMRSLSAGAGDHILSRKIKERVSKISGQMLLVALETLDFQRISDYDFGGTYSERGLDEESRTEGNSQREGPLGGLFLFVETHLHSSSEAVVLCENLYDTRTNYLANWRPRESRVLFYGEEIYHVVTSNDCSFESVETAVRESSGRWAIVVCSFCKVLPEAQVASEAFFDEIVANVKSIVTLALDEEGYLIWSLA